MITVSMFGGLGNQMFQYAAAKALAQRHGVELALDLSGFRAYPQRSFMLDRLRIPEAAAEGSGSAASEKVGNYFFHARWRARIDGLMARTGLPRRHSPCNSYREPHFHFDHSFMALGPRAKLFGYFQSERYFNVIADQIRGYFALREPLGASARAAADRIARSRLPVSIHIRRGDYVQASAAAVHGLLDGAYYRKALRQLEDSVVRPDLFVFSDDRVAATQVLNFVPPERVTFVHGDSDRPWEDMALIARCRHHVIANSSFSWWGAWLNPSRDKIVVAPRAWFTKKALQTRDTKDLYPAGWVQV